MGTFDDTLATARYFVTTSHCTEKLWALDSSDARQGGSYFAREIADVGTFSGSPCASGKVCRYSDASVFKYNDPSSIGSDDGRVALPASTGDTSFTSYVTTTSTASPYSGMTVVMVGATSGRQSGSVSHACVDMYGVFSSYPTYGLLCQSRATYFAADGDSGAPVLTLYGGGVASATGIHVATVTISGQTYRYFSPMTAVLDEFYWGYSALRQLSPVVY